MNGTVTKWVLGILGGLAGAGIIGNVTMYGQSSSNTSAIKSINQRLDRVEQQLDRVADKTDTILMELRK